VNKLYVGTADLLSTGSLLKSGTAMAPVFVPFTLRQAIFNKLLSFPFVGFLIVVVGRVFPSRICSCSLSDHLRGFI